MNPKIFIISGTNGAGKSTALARLREAHGSLAIFDCDATTRPHPGDAHIANQKWHLETLKSNIDAAHKEFKLGRASAVFGVISPDEMLSAGYDIHSNLFAFALLTADDQKIRERILASAKITEADTGLCRFIIRRQTWLAERYRRTCGAFFIDTTAKSTDEVVADLVRWMAVMEELPHASPYLLGRPGGDAEEFGILSSLTGPGTRFEKDHPPAETEASPASSDIAEVVAAVDPYQPLYRAPDVKQKPVQRICWDRAWAIENALPNGFGGCRVLDIGCALGFFSLYAADRGANVIGYDIEDKNVRICQYLAQKSKLSAAFSTQNIQKSQLESLLAYEFDVCFFLSVAHHICNSQGLEYTQDYIRCLTTKVRSCFIELAVAEEEVKFPWRAKLPADPMTFFDKCRDVNIQPLGHFPVHISRVPRPLYHVSWS